MKTLKHFCILLCGIITAGTLQAAHLRSNILLSAKMDGAQENPAVVTNALGVGALMLNETMDTLCVSIDWTGTSGMVAGLHIHEAAMGSNGPVVVDLSPFISGTRIRTFLTGADLAMLNMTTLLSGGYYLNAHTAANPNGEIRGQILQETDYSFPIMASGANEIPPVMTNAAAVGFVNMSKDMNMLTYHIILQDLSGAATGAHLHLGSAGTNGPVEIDMTPDISGNMISGFIMNPSQLFLDSLMADAVYLNVHTAANPNGEVRSQLTTSRLYLYFDSRLNGAQEVPSVNTTAMGAASLRLNSTMDSLWYDIAVDNLSGTITGAHLHNASLAMNGPVVIDMTPDINGFRISGVATGAALSQMFISELLEGNIYVNIHTAANPNGEIRGQVYRLLREGYTISLDGNQEVPTVNTNASGGGMVSVSREQQNLHVMLVASGLSITGAHFHNNVAGQNGPVIYDLTPWVMNDGIFGYWTSDDAVPFTVMQSVRFRNDSVYVNLHTGANPNGEIRGQVLRGFNCSPTITSLNDEAVENMFSVYPNPFREQLKVTFDNKTDGEHIVTVTDISGRVMFSDVIDASGASFDLVTSGWISGVYFLRIDGYTVKVIKQ